MGKISPVSSKYIINAIIDIEGVVDKPDVIGAIFGQTEGLLGIDLELRELQRSGRIGRIEVNVDTKNGKSQGTIIIPSSLDQVETSLVGAALEIIQRIGPCNAQVKVKNIEDVRVSKRKFVLERAKSLLKTMQDQVLPDTQELAEEVAQSIRTMEIREYGKDRLPAGPTIDDSDEIILVEGRADVLNLLKCGFKNVIALNGTSVPQTIKELTKRKETTAFVDGDRGGSLIIRGLMSAAELDFVTIAPDGKEVEELTKKEIHKALRSRITAEQASLEISSQDTSNSLRKPVIMKRPPMQQRTPLQQGRPPQQRTQSQQRPTQTRPPTQTRTIQRQALKPDEKKKFGEMLESLIGTRGAYLLDTGLTVLGKVPFTELNTTLKSLNKGVYAVIFDGVVDRNLISVAEKTTVKHIIAMDTKVKSAETRINITTAANL